MTMATQIATVVKILPIHGHPEQHLADEFQPNWFMKNVFMMKTSKGQWVKTPSKTQVAHNMGKLLL